MYFSFRRYMSFGFGFMLIMYGVFKTSLSDGFWRFIQRVQPKGQDWIDASDNIVSHMYGWDNICLYLLPLAALLSGKAILDIVRRKFLIRFIFLLVVMFFDYHLIMASERVIQMNF